MKMRSLIFGMPAMVSVSLFLLGCPTDSDDGGGGDTFTDLTANNPYPQTDSSDIDGKSYSNSLNIDSVVRNDSTGVVIITLSGIMVDVRDTKTSGENGVTGTSSDGFWEYAYPYDGTFKAGGWQIWGFHF
jgi:hypothetical protein